MEKLDLKCGEVLRFKRGHITYEVHRFNSMQDPVYWLAYANPHFVFGQDDYSSESMGYGTFKTFKGAIRALNRHISRYYKEMATISEYELKECFEKQILREE